MAKPDTRPGRYFYPFLFALFPALFLFTHNIEEVSFNVLLVPAILTLLLTGLVYIIGRVAIKSRPKTALSTFIFVFMAFSYGHFYNLVRKLLVEKLKLPEIVLLLIWIILFGLLIFQVIKTKKDLTVLNTFLNGFVFILIAYSLFQIGLFYAGALKSTRLVTDIPDTLVNRDELIRGDELPDIYYLIFDRYANTSILKDYYDYDNGGFTRYLEEKGFYVAEESRCNYAGTHLSLASSLNMEYLTSLISPRPVPWKVFYQMIKDFKVRRLLKSLGYKHLHFGSWYEGTRVNPYADLNYRAEGLISLSQDFLKNFFETTVLNPLIRNKLFVKDQRILDLQQFQKLAELPSLPGPKFVFLHMLLPHHPFLFDADGRIPPGSRNAEKVQEQRYLSQLEFTNSQIKTLVDELLAKSKRPPIIILQSDEGPGEEEKPVRRIMRLAEMDQAVVNIRVRCYILNAYYLPGADADRLLYPSISPVNTFRVVFNQYFGTQFPLLKDEYFRAVGEKKRVRKLDRLKNWVWTYRLKTPYPHNKPED